MELERASTIAQNLIKTFGRPAVRTVERIEIAGSVRRGKPEVKDIELVAIPNLMPPRPEFGQKLVARTRQAAVLYNLQRTGLIELIKDGEKYKQFWILQEHAHLIKVDLFLVTPPAQWGVIQVIRTGPAEFSQWMVTPISKGGALPDGFHVDGGCVLADGMVACAQHMPEEQDFFTFCGLEWIEPGKREARWLTPIR